jgi:hypothetical protein
VGYDCGMTDATAPSPQQIDEDEDVPCYRHPSRLTALRCVTCDRPICGEECAIPAAVGFKCPDDARIPRAARALVPTKGLVLGAAAGIASAAVFGLLLEVFRLPFLGIILAYVAGLVIGDLTRRASGGYRDPLLARIAGAAAFIGLLVFPVLAGLPSFTLQELFWPLVAAVFAAVGAYSRFG